MTNQDKNRRVLEANERLGAADEERNKNYVKFFQDSNWVDDIHREMVEDLSPHKKQEIIYSYSNQANIQARYKERISDIPKNDITSEAEEIKLENERLTEKANHTDFVKGVLERDSVPVPENYRTAYATTTTRREEALEKNKELTDNHLACLSEYISAKQEYIDATENNNGGPSNSGGENNNGGPSNSGGNGNERSSLLDDFADPSLEQPSYMDPED